MMRAHTRGFTLIELLVVIAIIGTLASVALASLNTARQKARDAARLSEVRAMKTALEMYRLDHPNYQVSGAGCGGFIYQFTGLQPYMNTLPRDPLYGGTTADYRFCANNQSYAIRVRFEDPNRPGTDANGYCKTGKNVAPNWWGTGVPECIGI
jgi:type II secretion system protein G